MAQTKHYFYKGCAHFHVAMAVLEQKDSEDMDNGTGLGIADHSQLFNLHCDASGTGLGIADHSQPFILHCDASGTGLGAVLYQHQQGKLKVIAYASRGLNKTEVNYPAHKREFLALKWAMTEKFHDYIVGSRVTVVTDNNPLCHVLKNAKLDAVSHRWLSSLSLYDFDLVYKQGSTHTDADGLSRRPQDPPEADEEYRDTLEKVGFLLEKARRFQDDNPQVVNRSAVVSILTAKSTGRPEHSIQQTGPPRASPGPGTDDLSGPLVLGIIELKDRINMRLGSGRHP
ncbi:hypothetical protein C0Q70_21230 [Pomacea canaliculata]|uniref:Reverse transcriptase RNase H-like domain-containing protein n=1 Tax=Pomacea canaliculata TaxID=400727 RepID=A0A2T7NBY1_POMCA|nr:hypothetical protein C0Q70_21230 [Pomacea canaliculata]